MSVHDTGTRTGYDLARNPWAFAVLTYGVGDTATTVEAVGRGLPEANPLYAAAFDAVGVAPALVGLKVLAFACFVLLYRNVDRRAELVPWGVAVLGTLLLVWNLGQIAGAA